jgi:hypothetical protein
MKNLALSPTLTRVAGIIVVAPGWLLITVPVFAKQVGEALTDMSEVEQSDPGGYTLMVISICLLFVIASALIGVTTWFMIKGKKKAK